MGVLTSLFAGVSGMNAAGQQISIIGDNIANVNTPGFKASRAEFQDVLAGNLAGSGSAGQIGAGARIAGVSQSFTQGSLESTDVTTDLAIDGGGFFVLQDTTGISYTRAGLFRLDSQRSSWSTPRASRCWASASRPAGSRTADSARSSCRTRPPCPPPRPRSM